MSHRRLPDGPCCSDWPPVGHGRIAGTLDLACGSRPGSSKVRINSPAISLVTLLCFFPDACRNPLRLSFPVARCARERFSRRIRFCTFPVWGVAICPRRKLAPLRVGRTSSGGVSYSLYVLHFPFLLFLRCLWVPAERWQPTPSHLLSASLVGAVCLLFAWLISLFTEKKTDVARRQVKRLLA